MVQSAGLLVGGAWDASGVCCLLTVGGFCSCLLVELELDVGRGILEGESRLGQFSLFSLMTGESARRNPSSMLIPGASSSRCLFLGSVLLKRSSVSIFDPEVLSNG